MLPTQISERRTQCFFTGISKISILEDQFTCLKETKSIKNYKQKDFTTVLYFWFGNKIVIRITKCY